MHVSDPTPLPCKQMVKLYWMCLHYCYYYYIFNIQGRQLRRKARPIKRITKKSCTGLMFEVCLCFPRQSATHLTAEKCTNCE